MNAQDAKLFAIILAGGASSRLHATSPTPTVDKPLLLLDGDHVITHVIDAVTQWVPRKHTLVVGPDSLPTGDIATIYENPPQSGPYMAVYTALQYLGLHHGSATGHQSVLLLGADMPFLAPGLDQLVEHHRAHHTSVAITRAGERLQPLLSYVPRRLAHELFAEPVANAGIMRTLQTTEYRLVDVAEAVVADVDTYQDAKDAGVRF